MAATFMAALLARQTGDLGAYLVQRFSRRHVEGLHVRAAEGVVGDEVLRDRDELEQLALRRNDVDTGLRIQRLRRAPQLVHAGRRVQVTLRVDAHPVRASPG